MNPALLRSQNSYTEGDILVIPMSVILSSRTGPGPNSDISKAGGDRAKILNPWEKALASLSDEDKKQFSTSSDAVPLSMLDVLKSVGLF